MGCYRLGTGAVRILDAHNVEFDNYRRMSLHASSLFRKKYYGRESRLLRLEEAEACRRHDAIFATSERDRRLLETLVPGVPKFVIPNGVDPSYFTPAAGSPEPASLVFSGMMAYVPNNDGMLYFLDEIFPLIRAKVPGLKVYIVGNRPPKSLLERASESVIVTGYVEDVRPFISKASVYIVPLRMGSGTRLKILEAMSMGKPVVTTSIGCEGLDVVNGETAVIADDPLSFAGSVVDLLGDGQMRERLSRNGMELVRQKYDWSVVDGLVEEAYLGLRRGAAPGAGAERERAKTPVPSVSH
jgi:glycosyltransferase involved in cell wall biosynthesis